MAEIRDLGYLKWRDPWAWMEPMKGKRWETHIKKEKQHFNELASQSYVEKETRQMEKELVQVKQYSHISGFKIGCNTIDIIFTPNSRFLWKWSWKKTTKPASDIDVQGNIVWYISGDEDEFNKNKLICESSDGKIIWIKKNVSTQVAIVGELCYYIKVIDYFRTVELCVCNAQTGNNEKVLYKETDKKRDIFLYKCANKTLYVGSSSPINSELYRINGTELKRLVKNSLLQSHHRTMC